MTRCSVIIPALNEEASVAVAVTSARGLGDAEILVVDGGSRDRTVAIAEQAGARVVVADRGRGLQCNAGAAAARGEWLLFLHSDSCLPADAGPALESMMARGGRIGTFRLRFEPSTPSLRLFARLARLKSRFTTFGDQGITIRRDLFEALGGFPEWELFEDVRLLEKARAITSIHDIPAHVTTSSRRLLHHGVWREQLRNAGLMARYLAGTPPKDLVRGDRG